MDSIKILIVDDHAILRKSLIALLNRSKLYGAIKEANDGKEAIEILENEKFDVVLMDINMPELDGVDATEIILGRNPDTKILVLSSDFNQNKIQKMLKFGALGYVLKDAEPEELYTAIDLVAEGHKYYSRKVSEQLINQLVFGSASNTNSILQESISERELEILKLVAEGYTDKEIGEELFISYRTVGSHKSNLLQKTESKNSAALVKFAINNNLIDN